MGQGDMHVISSNDAGDITGNNNASLAFHD